MIADECVAALDVTIQAQIVALFRDLIARTGLTLIFIAHDLAIVRNLCEPIVVMHHGEIVEDGPSARVFAHPERPYTAALIAAIPDIDPDHPHQRRHPTHPTGVCDMIRKPARAVLLGLVTTTIIVLAANAEGVLTIGRREDGTTFDPINTAQNIDFWIFSNVFDTLVRVDNAGKNLIPGFAQSWEVSDDALTRYNNEVVKPLVADARLEMDPVMREAMYPEIQKTAKAEFIGSTSTTAPTST